MPILTLVTPKKVIDFDLPILESCPAGFVRDRLVLDIGRAVRWHTQRLLSKDEIDTVRARYQVDVFMTETMPDIRLFLADMDSTIVTGETLDDMADMASIGDRIAAITARAMRGELDFEAALTERISLLKGQPQSLVDRALNSLTLNAGAEELLSHMKSKGVYCVLISGGFVQFTSHVAETLRFDAHFGNELLFENGVFSGAVKRPILDKHFKLKTLQELQTSMGLRADQIMAIGDGANDLPMLQAAGMGVAYYGKPLLREALINRVEYTDLAALAYIV